MFVISRNFYYRIALFSIFIIPLFGLYDFLISIEVFENMNPTHSRINNPYRHLIVLKDLISLFILLVFALDFLSTKNISKISLIILILALYPFFTCDSLGEIVAGMRQSIAFVYISLGLAITNYGLKNFNIKHLISRLIWAIKLVLIIELFMCLLQLLLGGAHDGLTFIGPRVLGSFINPNTISMYALISIVFIHLFSLRITSIIPYHIISIFIILAAGSRGGVLAISFLYFYIFISSFNSTKNKSIATMLCIIILVLLITNINEITSKPLSTSFLNGARIQALFDYISKVDYYSFMTGQGWGWNTSWYRAIYPVRELNYPADSFYTSILIQIGPLFASIFMAILAFIFSLAGKKGIFLLIIFLIIGLQINILEFYPIINILFLSLGLLIGLNQALINQKEQQGISNNEKP
jgi:hypothetical protein